MAPPGELSPPRIARLGAGDWLFAVGFVAYVGYAVAVLATGLGAAAAGPSGNLHETFHLWGLRPTLLGRLGQAMGDAAHRTVPLAAIDYAFSAFNLALAGLLLWLRPRERAARLLVVGMTGTAAVFNLQAYGVYEAMSPTALDAGLHAAFQVVAASSYVLALLVFPDGRLVPRWSPGGLALLYVPAAAVVVALALGIRDTSRTVALIMVFGLLTPAVGVAAQAYRSRRAASDVERQQSRLLFWALVPALVV
ncbi:MAG: hypothetical protein M3387_08905, partial [Actinomycetota bacterium]|nr:hypothetical protein [Actinomycetota bacterium]